MYISIHVFWTGHKILLIYISIHVFKRTCVPLVDSRKTRGRRACDECDECDECDDGAGGVDANVSLARFRAIWHSKERHMTRA
jgi:hypothetical protein